MALRLECLRWYPWQQLWAASQQRQSRPDGEQLIRQPARGCAADIQLQFINPEHLGRYAIISSAKRPDPNVDPGDQLRIDIALQIEDDFNAPSIFQSCVTPPNSVAVLLQPRNF